MSLPLISQGVTLFFLEGALALNCRIVSLWDFACPQNALAPEKVDSFPPRGSKTLFRVIPPPGDVRT